jgi:hypothetical protein
VIGWLTDLLLGSRIGAPHEVADAVSRGRVTLRKGRLVPWVGGRLGRLSGPAAAVTLRRTIVLDPDARLTTTLLAHELTHVRQWEQDRLFPIRYALATLRHGYHHNPYEVEARSIARAADSSPGVTT